MLNELQKVFALGVANNRLVQMARVVSNVIKNSMKIILGLKETELILPLLEDEKDCVLAAEMNRLEIAMYIAKNVDTKDERKHKKRNTVLYLARLLKETISCVNCVGVISNCMFIILMVKVTAVKIQMIT